MNLPRRSFQPLVEPLEDRCVPVNFGVPWIDPQHLTLSFAPDGTSLQGQNSSLTQFLHSRLPGVSDAAWQREILRAFQTWASYANIDIAVTGDGGQAFGTSGAPQHDERFGDIRLGGRSFSTEVLSLTMPPDPYSPNTWAGDVMLNTASDYIHSLSSLYLVMLHESANVLGLRDSTNSNSVRFPFFNAEHAVPLAEDIAAMQALYGVRTADDYEGAQNNDVWSRASRLSYPWLAPGGDGSTPLTAFADLTTTTDVDYYWFRPVSNYNGPVTIRLQTAGISLLIPRITVYNQAGQVIGSATADSPTGSYLSVHLNQVNSSDSIYLKVEGATNDAFRIGRYALAISFDSRLDVSESTVRQILASPYEELLPLLVDILYLVPNTPLNYDFHLNDTLSLAWSLDSLAGYAPRTAYTTLGSLHDSTDRDYYKIMSPDATNSVLTVDLWSLSSNLTQLNLKVYDTNGQQVNANTIAKHDGTIVLQVANVQANSRYYVRVSHGTQGGDGQTGNYGLGMRFGSVEAKPRLFQSQQLSPTIMQDPGTFYVAQTQVFTFSLAAQGVNGNNGNRVRYQILDDQGQVKLNLEANSGETATVDTILLKPGTYSVRVTLMQQGAPGAVVNYQLTGQSLSDPIGPQLDDTTNLPLFLDGTNPPIFSYPGNIVTVDPFLMIFVRT
jgi:hypothetical protein